MDDEIKAKVTIYNQDSNYPKEIMENKNITQKSLQIAIETAKCKAIDLKEAREMVQRRRAALKQAEEYSKQMHEEYTESIDSLFAAFYRETEPTKSNCPDCGAIEPCNKPACNFVGV